MEINTAMRILLEKIPEFSAQWSDYLGKRGREERTPYSDIESFSDFTVDQIEEGKIAVLQRIFQVIELVLENSSKEFKDTLAIAFFENITNLALNGVFNLKEILKLLGPNSLEICRELDVFWGQKDHRS